MSGTTIEPCVFGSTDDPLFGMLTRPGPGTETDRGVVICAPLGYENVIYHRQLGLLARRLAESGRTVLRFDWPGVGDSAGDDTDPGLVEAYLDSVHGAAAALRSHADVTEVDVVGLRIGATLALVAAARTELTSNLVLWSPHTTGREYLRELRVFDRMNVKRFDPPPSFEPPDGEEALGFVVAPATLEGLAAIDLRTLELAEHGPRRILLAGRDVEPDQRLTDALRGAGAHVDTAVLPGLREVAMGWTSETPVPTGAFAAIVDWLPQGSPVTPAARPTAPATMTVRANGTAVRERAVVLHQEEPVFGIVSEPDDDSASDSWVVFATNRYARRIGPNRLYTTWARDWAAQGLPSFRLDLSGTGDAGGSEEETDEDMYSQLVLDDARKALAYLRDEHGARRFLFIGLCSGGTTGFKAAVVEPDVDGVILLNPQMLIWAARETEVTRGDWVRSRILRLSSWRRLLQDRGALLRNSAPAALGALAASVRWRIAMVGRRIRRQGDLDPVQTWIRSSLDTVCGRGCTLTFVFSEGDAGLGYLERHLGSDVVERLAERGIAVETVPCATHTFHALWTQEALRDVVEERLAASGFPLREAQHA